MKLTKLSLAAIIVAGITSSSIAADTLADAFKEGKISGDIKSYYFNKDDGTSREGIINFGLLLNYKTADYHGFGLNFTTQSNAAPYATDAQKTMFKDDEYGSGTVLSEAYLSYTKGNTIATIGRMFLDTPLVATSGSRIVKDAFEGATIVNTDLSDTTLVLGYIQKYQNRTDGTDSIGEFEKFSENGAYTVAITNKSITNLTLRGAYADILGDAYPDLIDGVKAYYAEAMYSGKTSEFGYSFGAQYYGNKYDKAIAGKDTANAFGVKAGISKSGVNAYVAYSQVGNDGRSVTAGVGNGADLLYTDSLIISDNYANNTKSYAVGVSYDITSKANIGVLYAELNDDKVLDASGKAGAGKTSYTGVYGSYALKNLVLGAEYDKEGKDGDGDQFRLKATYSF